MYMYVIPVGNDFEFQCSPCFHDCSYILHRLLLTLIIFPLSPAADFSLTDVQVVLNATVTQACVQIDITDDTFLEDAETFTLSLAAEPPATLDPSSTTVTITDDGKAAAYTMLVCKIICVDVLTSLYRYCNYWMG